MEPLYIGLSLPAAGIALAASLLTMVTLPTSLMMSPTMYMS